MDRIEHAGEERVGGSCRPAIRHTSGLRPHPDRRKHDSRRHQRADRARGSALTLAVRLSYVARDRGDRRLLLRETGHREHVRNTFEHRRRARRELQLDRHHLGGFAR
ncbi:hypothetical protein CZ774_06700 [Frigoribacterium sp. JB110]|nr:hypothetical protein CZ774_06700 [Frigoribacterium sp. JB110]